MFGNDRVLSERYLLDKNGNFVFDPKTSTRRRLDHVLIGDDGKARAIEVTSKNANKDAQMRKEERIRAVGGVFVRNKTTGELVEVVNLSRIMRIR